MIKVFFIDKDGTLVDNSGYPDKIPRDELLRKEVVEGLRYMGEKGYKIIIISNQPWIAKNIIKLEEVEEIFKSLIKKLKERGIEIDDYFYCPHQSSDKCECKKPKPKMIFDAENKHKIDLNNSFIVGDMDIDIEFGKRAGIKTILVKTGRGKDFLDSNPDYVIENINEIFKII